MKQDMKDQQGATRRMVAMVVFAVMLIVAAIIVYMQVSQSRQSNPAVTTYAECKDAGGSIAESFPEQCKLDGKTYENTDARPKSVDSGYVGLTEEEALNKAKKNDVAARVVSRDGESLTVTTDLVDGRLNFVVEDGKVTKVDKEEINLE